MVGVKSSLRVLKKNHTICHLVKRNEKRLSILLVKRSFFTKSVERFVTFSIRRDTIIPVHEI